MYLRTYLFGARMGISWRNCSDLRGSADYSAYCGGATEHGISTANRFRPLKREQLLLGVAVGYPLERSGGVIKCEPKRG